MTNKKEEIENVNLIDLLMDADETKFKKQEKEVEIPRLSKLFGTPFIITLKELPRMLADDIDDKYITYNSDGKADMKTGKIVDNTLMNAVYVNGQLLFKNDGLLKKFGAPTPIQLMDKILLPGEKLNLYAIYNDMVGIVPNSKRDLVKEVKKR